MTKRKIDADLEIVLDDESLWVHSGILILSSDVFRNMLSSGLKEETEWKIKLPGKTKATFQIFYNSLLTETFDYKMENDILWAVLELAQQYQTLRLDAVLIELILKSCLNKENFTRTYKNAHRLKHAKILDACETKLYEMAVEILFDRDCYNLLPFPWPTAFRNRLNTIFKSHRKTSTSIYFTEEYVMKNTKEELLIQIKDWMS